MNVRVNRFISLISLVTLISCAGCQRRTGEPKDQDELQRPEKSFRLIVCTNRTALHVTGRTGQEDRRLISPIRSTQALVDDASLKHWITSGYARYSDACLWRVGGKFSDD